MIKECKGNREEGSPPVNLTLGKAGEEAAIEFYCARGFELVARNWRAGRFAEVDLILRARSGMLIFAEVKTRRVRPGKEDSISTGFESVGWRKRKKIVTAAQIFISKRALVDIPCRFDVLVVSCDMESPTASLRTTSIVYVPDAFSL